MEAINFPVAVDWFNGAVLSLVIAIIAATINKAITNDISGKKATTIVLATIGISIIVLTIWYNVIGAVFLLQAKYIEAKHGCSIAFSIYSKATQSNPQLVFAREGLVNCALEINKSDDAIQTLESLLPTLSTKWSYWVELAQLYSYQGRVDKMQDAVSRISDLCSDNNSQTILNAISISAIKHPSNSAWITALGKEFVNDFRYSMAEGAL